MRSSDGRAYCVYTVYCGDLCVRANRCTAKHFNYRRLQIEMGFTVCERLKTCHFEKSISGYRNIPILLNDCLHTDIIRYKS